jgi:hypothetical protein
LPKKLLLAITVLVSVSFALLAVEWLYRLQLIDTYRPELRSANPAGVLEYRDQPTLLVLGDSFSVGRTSYVGILQNSLREWQVVNGAVSGTGVLQALYMAPGRFARFHPSVFVYQVYVGNDLFDLRYPVNWETTSLARNAYWFLANHFRVLSYLNYRLRRPQEAPAASQRTTGSLLETEVAAAAEDTDGFSVERYDERVKLYLRAEPGLIEDSILVRGGRQRDYGMFLDRLSELLAYCKPGWCRAYVLVIPHVSQVDASYLTYFRRLGARFTNPDALRRAEYPFVVHLRARLVGSPNVKVVDPLPDLREAQLRVAMYYATDEHLTPAGQQMLAGVLTEQLHLR